MELKDFVPSKVELHGCSPLPASTLAQQLLSTGSLATAPGDFILVLSGTFRVNGPETSGKVVASSALNAFPFFYSQSGNELILGKNVSEIAPSISPTTGWSWNRRALASLLAFGHPTGTDTLHADIKRLPPASVLRHTAGQTTITRYATTVNPSEFILAEVLEEQDAVLKQHLLLAGKRPALALTAGMDSRLLIAAALHFGVKPVTFTFGSSKAADVEVARAVSRDFFLEHRHIELSAEDLLSSRTLQLLSGTAGGLITMDQLAHAAFVQKAGLEEFSSYISALNADCVRFQYEENGFLAGLGRLRGSRYLTEQQIIKNRSGFPPALAKKLSDGVSEWVKSIEAHDKDQPLGGLAHYHLMDKVRQEYGNLLGLYERHTKVVSPFTDRRYADLVYRLPVGMKKKSLFHRLLIRYFFPGLMDYPVNGQELHVGDQSGGWRSNGGSGGGWMPDLFSHPRLRELVMDSRELDEWCRKEDREQMLKRRSVHGVNWMLTVAGRRG